MAMPGLVSYQVQYFVTFIVAFIGQMATEVGAAIGDVFTSGALDNNAMMQLTTGIFGPQNGLIYWINEKVIWLLENLPYAALGDGLRDLLG